MQVIYQAKNRLCYRAGELLLHAEKAMKTGSIFMELRETGTGGPLSGLLHGTYRDGSWDASIPNEATTLSEAALRHFSEA